jgi:hypothetical protein
MSVFLVVTLCGFVGRYQRFGRNILPQSSSGIDLTSCKPQLIGSDEARHNQRGRYQCVFRYYGIIIFDILSEADLTVLIVKITYTFSDTN